MSYKLLGWQKGLYDAMGVWLRWSYRRKVFAVENTEEDMKRHQEVSDYTMRILEAHEEIKNRWSSVLKA